MENMKLGFGLMRLPKISGGSEKDIDKALTADMIDLFLERGYKYFDTAFVYHEGESEKAVRELLTNRYPRDKFYLATKMPLWDLNKHEDMEEVFKIQLERTGVSYFDNYLLHGIDRYVAKKLDEFDGWAYMKSLKERGLIRKLGFSFHSSAEHLDEVLSNHPELEFVQLQLNYADWESKEVQSRLCYEVAEKHNKPVIVMEPVRGGALAAMPPEIREVFLSAAPDKSIASWAFRFVGSLPMVSTVLSGMSDMQQLRDNMDTFDNFKPLTEDEHKVIKTAVEMLSKMPTIPCTGCKYCVTNCPKRINIPRLIPLINDFRTYRNLDANKRRYNMTTARGGKASDCILCSECERHCPQNLKITGILSDIAKTFE